ncbi:MAG TPA: prepilin-type N-terminal cleavage/methylation domain-containing protein [Candidatus Saccharimonadales bacterium]|nr:prepilin-type N-terminal cleavage/methylation domain-containing protein [Candidatus Saccharimonadales bacterium]
MKWARYSQGQTLQKAKRFLPKSIYFSSLFARSDLENKSRGYTIIEVMIVLAVTGILFSSAVLMFHGSQGRTALSQNMYDFASKLESYANEVNSGVYSGAKTYSCSISGGKASLSPSAGGSQGSNFDCLFLGRVIQLIPGSSKVYVYTVIGNRNIYSGGTDTGKTAKILEETNPQIASNNGAMVMVDVYNLPTDVSFLSAKATSITDGSVLDGYGDLVGIYADLSDSGGAQSNLESVAFPFSGGGNTPYSTSMAECVSLNSSCASANDGYSGSGYRRIGSWNICVQSGGDRAEVKVKNTAQGISTEVDSLSCS